MSSELIRNTTARLQEFAELTKEDEEQWRRCENDAAEAKATLEARRQTLSRELFHMDYVDLEERLESL